MAKILIIDDDVAFAFGMNAMLKRAGFWTKVAHNGYEGIETAQTFNPDLIICDVMMPEINGFDVLKRLTVTEKNRDIPFIFLTARAAPADKLHGLREGADDYITKPFLSEELLLRIEAILRRKDVTINLTSKKMQKKIDGLQDEIRYNAYIVNVEIVRDSMLEGAIKAEDLLNLTSKVWRNTIYEERDTETDRYTLQSASDFNEDFNVSLGRMFSDSNTKYVIDQIETNQADVAAMIKELQAPPEGLEKAHDMLLDLFSAYTSLTSYSVNPSGNLNSFTENKNKKIDEFSDLIQKLETQMPSRK